jgi:hypothetical protein
MFPDVRDSPNITSDTRVIVTLVARLLLLPVTQKRCMCDEGVCTCRMCVYSRALIRIEIVFYCTRAI